MSDPHLEQSADKASVLVVDDDPDHVELLLLALEEVPGFELEPICCSCLDQAFAAMDDPSIRLVLIDYRLGGNTCESFVAKMRQTGDPRPVVVVTGQGDEYIAVDLMRQGADGYLAKRDLRTRLPQVLEQIHDHYTRKQVRNTTHLETAERLRTLTDREIQIVDLIVDGFLNKEIARKLHRSEHTIKLHRAAIMRKMNAHTAGDLVRIVLSARMNGLRNSP